jgi:hypothetical protein
MVACGDASFVREGRDNFVVAKENLQTISIADQPKLFRTRQSFVLGTGKTMEYELFLPSEYDPSVSTPFIVSVPGMEQTHVNGFSRRLPSDQWVVAVAIRPASAPHFFEGSGADGDGVWHLRQLCNHLLSEHSVYGGRFTFVGVSNGGSSVLRFATVFPEICCGVVVVTGSIYGLVPHAQFLATLRRLMGLPIDMYVGTKDECGFFPPMIQLEKDLAAVDHFPKLELTIFKGAGHCCSHLVEQHVIRAKILLMMARTWPLGRQFQIDLHSAPSTNDTGEKLQVFCNDLGIPCSFTMDGGLKVSCGCGAFSERARCVADMRRSPPVIKVDRALSRTPPPSRTARSLTPVKDPPAKLPKCPSARRLQTVDRSQPSRDEIPPTPEKKNASRLEIAVIGKVLSRQTVRNAFENFGSRSQVCRSAATEQIERTSRTRQPPREARSPTPVKTSPVCEQIVINGVSPVPFRQHANMRSHKQFPLMVHGRWVATPAYPL